MKLIIKGGRVIDPANGTDKKLDILVENGKVVKKSSNIDLNGEKVIDAANLIVTPGFIDMHTHLREPGREDKETIASGTRSAARGGFTTICCMPNTQPPVDSIAGVKFILVTAAQEGIINVFPVGCITKGREGKELAEIGKMNNAGIVGISDDGSPVMNAQIMRHALEYTKMFDIPVLAHCEDLNLSAGGVMNEGFMSTVLGLKGIPRQAEETMVSRDIELTELTGGKIHIQHITTLNSVEIIRQAKRKKIKVSCETCPQYFSLSDEAVRGYNTSAKVNPPLRTDKDIKAIKKGIADGTIDCIASDHAPHTDVEKAQEFDAAPFGTIGLETMFPLIMTNLVDKKVLTLSRAIAKITINPARVLGLNKGTLSKGADADIAIINPKPVSTVTGDFVSLSKNSPFIGMKLKGSIVATIAGGKVVMQDGR